jgi:SET domain
LTPFPGQLRQWESHHRKICKVYNQFVASAAYQALPPHERLDAMLLSHLIAEVYASKVTDPDDEQPALSIFLSLRPSQTQDISAPPVCRIHMSRALVTNDVVDALYSRFGNNNFAIHSHLTTFAHGIFPVASKLFNHSCLPNAAAKYIITPSHPVRMEVVALSPIDEGEEVRHSHLRLSCLKLTRIG